LYIFFHVLVKYNNATHKNLSQSTKKSLKIRIDKGSEIASSRNS